METGELVQWEMGNLQDCICEGLFLEMISEEMAEVICTSMGGAPHKMKVQIEISKLKTL